MCTTVNSAEYMPLPHEGEEHDCVAESKEFVKPRKDLQSSPLETAGKRVLYVDGSCYRDHVGNHAGYAVIEQVGGELRVLEVEECPQPCSAQLAELKALTRACELVSEEVADIYTDSAYAHGVCHLFGAIWKQRGFQKASGEPIQHKDQILNLITAMMKPKELAIIKSQEHKKGGEVAKGNSKADEVAKQASGCTAVIIASQVTLTLVPQPSLEDVKDMQNLVTAPEKAMWTERGAMEGEDGIWSNKDGLIIAPTPLLTLLISEANGVDHCARGEVWWWGGVLGAAAGEGVNTQLPGDRHSCQIISGRTIGRVIR